MMTIKGFPFNVDHDTNYVTYAGNLGGAQKTGTLNTARVKFNQEPQKILM